MFIGCLTKSLYSLVTVAGIDHAISFPLSREFQVSVKSGLEAHSLHLSVLLSIPEEQPSPIMKARLALFERRRRVLR